ncbi:3-oxoacyl-[acyl-carrier-protein] synthase 2 [mine drainage metagenome]|uniref:3-oxoacyl-[acyl-carrier-protein] synthase 2 n=1 Tax=mine drainage metagenome TaxID=410659 RepID=A0A1J5PNK7_9ZZZZ
MRRVVITGMGALTPLGNDVETFWKSLSCGHSGAGPITHFDATKFKTRFACEVKDFDVERYMDRKDARKVDYINTHATSTPDGDLNELKAIHSVFGEHVHKMNISATKSMTGHLLGAAGAVEAIACIQAVQHDLVPPTINVSDLDPGVPDGFNLTLGHAEHRKVNVAMSNTFGFGGHNAIVLFRKFDSSETDPSPKRVKSA